MTSLFTRFRKALRKPSGALNLEDHWVTEPQSEISGDLERWFWDNEDRVIDKWLHYFPVYERHFAPFRNSQVRVLEIGVQNGGSAQLWRRFFGPEATLFGIDIDPACAKVNGEGVEIRIGSQADPAFLESVVEEMGGVDIVIDDGSHVMAHIAASFEVLYPKLSSGGIYLVEDLHTAYWREYEGGYQKSSTFIETAKQIVDDIHWRYHHEGQHVGPSRNWTTGVHFYDSIVVLDKLKNIDPYRAVTGREFVHETPSHEAIFKEIDSG